MGKQSGKTVCLNDRYAPLFIDRFSTGRHSGSFFLKIGAGIFCFGHMTHMGLNLARRATAYESHNSTVQQLCGGGEAVLAHDVLYPIFSFIQVG